MITGFKYVQADTVKSVFPWQISVQTQPAFWQFPFPATWDELPYACRYSGLILPPRKIQLAVIFRFFFIQGDHGFTHTFFFDHDKCAIFKYLDESCSALGYALFQCLKPLDSCQGTNF